MAARQARLTPARWQRCKEVFGEVLFLPEVERRNRIEAGCAGDQGLSSAVRELLADHARSGGFLDPPAVTRSVQARVFLRAEGFGAQEDDWQHAVVGGRYRLHGRIGSGATGDVYRAEDLLTGDAVACKVLRQGWAEGLADGLRAETAALRLLRIPGVVRMIEEGTEEGRQYIVMELVVGSPFPGVARPAPWPRIAETAVSLLETLDRIHRAGFVHRDVKPANVLVGPEGQPTVLDLGIALHPGWAGRDEVGIVGTPNYLPPEQLRGEPATPASDLYAVGVMLYEALAGRLPHDAATLDGLLSVRHCAPPSLKDLAPACPADVAELVARLLKPDPDDRPRTAAEALALVEGASSRRDPCQLPWLGGDDVVRAIVAAAERGESFDVCGGPGSGRTRCLAEAAARLERAGKRILRFRPGAGFAGLLDAPEAAAFARLDEAKELARLRLAEWLRAGAAAFADDWARLEPWVAEVISAGRAHGTVVRALDGSAEAARPLRPLSRADLMDLFHGPDRVFHLREDAAAALHGRSRGLPGAVTDEASSWLRAGCARWDRGRLAVTREALDRLAAGGLDRLPRPGRVDLRSLPAHLRSLAALVQIAGRQATPEGLAPVARRPAWQVDAHLQELRSLGVVLDDGQTPAAPRAAVDILSVLTQEEVRDAHVRLASALPEGDEDRLGHLVAGGELASVPREARLLARRLSDGGNPGRAITVIEEALATAAADPARCDCLPILEDLVIAGLRAWSREALDRALYEIEMAPERSAGTHRLGELARSALALIQGTWERSLVAIEGMEPFPDGRLELARQTLRVFAARRGGPAREGAAIAAVSDWAATCGIPEARRSLLVWLGWLRYNEGRFAEAARLHGQAAALAADLASRVSSLTSRVAALMDDQRLGEAMEAADEALRAIAALRDPTAEARLLCNRRSIEYRLGKADAIDADLPDVIGRTGVRELEGLAALTEAAVAWRLGDLGVARRFAARSARVWTELGVPHFACLPHALRVASSPAADEAEVRELATMAARCPQPGLAVQALGLLAIARPDLSLALRIPGVWLEALPRWTWTVRREVLSVEEALYRRVERSGRDGTADGERDVHREAGADGLRP